jgi:hypothetical protein
MSVRLPPLKEKFPTVMDLSSNISERERGSSSGLNRFFAASALLLTVAFIALGMPKMPQSGIDASWEAAINEGVVRHLVFGRDLIFTFGPLGSVYSRFYHPGTDLLVLTMSIVIAIGAWSGFTLLCVKGRQNLVLLLPLMVAILQAPDAVFPFLPFMLTLATFRIAAPEADEFKLVVDRRVIILLVLLVAAISILPLIKGSFSGVVVVESLLSIALLFRAKRSKLAVWLSIVTVFCMSASWMLTGQSLKALPNFFVAQGPIFSGYTDAMSLPGPFASVVWDVLPAGSIVAVFYVLIARRRKVDGWIATAGVAAYLFITFKAGFVRADGHPDLSVAALILVAGALACFLSFRVAFLLFLLCATGWWCVEQQISDSNVKGPFERMYESIASTASGVAARIQRGRLESDYLEAKQKIRLDYHLPITRGTVDLYPNNLALLFGNDMNWSGRPILQSYSAYTPGLAQLNADHLLRRPPETIFFGLGAIDSRYPTLEDATSWPILLGNYHVVYLLSEYAVLKKKTSGSSAKIDPVFSRGSRALGTSVKIDRTGTGPIWAQIDVEPTLLGRIISFFYKGPTLKLLVNYADGKTKIFRFVPAMAKTGFLLSPTVTTAREFISLESSRSDELLADKDPVEFGIRGSSGTRWLWAKNFTYSLAKIQIMKDANVDGMLFSRIADRPTEEIVSGGDCSIDMVNGTDVKSRTAHVGDHLFTVAGWAAASGKDDIQNRGVLLEFKRSDGFVQYWTTKKTDRPDVGAFFGHNDLTHVGFESKIDGHLLSGSYQVSVVQSDGTRQLSCAGSKLEIVK